MGKSWVLLIGWLGMSAYGATLPVHAALVPPSEPTRPATSPSSERAFDLERERTADWLLAYQARAALWRDKTLMSQGIQVVVHRSVATLHGTVRSEELRRRAVQLVQRVTGITAVRDELRVALPVDRGPPTPRQSPPVDRQPDLESTDPPALPFPRKKPTPASLMQGPSVPANGPASGTLTGQTRSVTLQERAPADWQPVPAKTAR